MGEIRAKLPMLPKIVVFTLLTFAFHPLDSWILDDAATDGAGLRLQRPGRGDPGNTSFAGRMGLARRDRAAPQGREPIPAPREPIRGCPLARQRDWRGRLATPCGRRDGARNGRHLAASMSCLTVIRARERIGFDPPRWPDGDSRPSSPPYSR